MSNANTKDTVIAEIVLSKTEAYTVYVRVNAEDADNAAKLLRDYYRHNYKAVPTGGEVDVDYDYVSLVDEKTAKEWSGPDTMVDLSASAVAAKEATK